MSYDTSFQIVHVECGTCTACCRNQLVILTNQDDPGQYDVHSIETDSGTSYALKLKPNGECTYLGPGGCTIWGRQPYMCRQFSCIEFVRAWPKRRRRLEGAARGVDNKSSVFKAGLKRLMDKGRMERERIHNAKEKSSSKLRSNR